MTKGKKIIWIIGFFVVAVFLLIYAGIYTSYHHLTVNEFTLKSEKISSPVTLAVLADLHDHTFGTDNQELIDLTLAQQPDAILMLGDFINKDSSDHEELLLLIEHLSRQVPVYFAWGNHELGYMEANAGTDAATLENELEATGTATLETQLTAAGASVLDKQYQDVEIAGQPLRIGGMYDYAFALDGWNSCNPDNMDPEVYQFLTDFQSTDIFKLMLSHRPDSFIFGEASTTWDVDLVVSGHLHGGQVVLPFLGGLVGGDQGWFPEYVHGLYQKDNIHIFITSGLGSSKKVLPRFNNPPEIAVLRILPAE